MVKIFCDFNCPFCFAQHERITQLGLANEVEWCFIEHNPQIVSTANTLEQKKQLHDEFTLLKQRAAEVSIKKPSLCVNTQLVILYYISLYEIDKPKAALFRTHAFRAYWQQGLDISDQYVLSDLLKHVNKRSLKVSNSAIDTFNQWQQFWASHDTEKRLPAMVCESNGVLLGLQHINNIKSFIRGTYQADNPEPATCEAGSKPVVALIGLPNLEPLFAAEESGLHTLIFKNVSEFRLYKHRHIVKAIIFYIDVSMMDPWVDLGRLKQDPGVKEFVPVIGVAPFTNSPILKQGFLLGASDILELDNMDKNVFPIIHARITNYQILSTLSEHALIDGLTGLLNKRALADNLQKEWRQACRDQSTLSILMLDVDYFKGFNDLYGHCAGDKCLKTIANTLQAQVKRPCDQVARFGGEEFLILLPDTDEAGLSKVIKRLTNAIADLALKHERNIASQDRVVTVCIGGVTAQAHADHTPTEMIQMADKALYQCKSNGRNQSFQAVIPLPEYAQALTQGPEPEKI
ncbi:hypothetical protein C2869_10985 [Saccharobesus litoralis]|uniref:diguanylate cyclase n=1 Tax=Saccharobesus litoralis TaxID=2172099 RepID=A0A2S0VRT8_9ALTE|nr:diguanylate cyclase [Saccharobesus litoralis]AWB66927.1 hypothetical protein C2869_10985 [Saccharobesus litoralis]